MHQSLKNLEAEAIYIFREVAAEAKNPVFLYSIGKDSSVMLHIALKAFYPALPPFKFLHVDTKWKFKEMIEFRDLRFKELGLDLIVYTNHEGFKRNVNPFTYGSAKYTDIMKTKSLKMALDSYKFDMIIGGARRDEEKSRAKERIFSIRSEGHIWDPKNQRPELWNLFNTYKKHSETFRVFPLSNWTEMDIWRYIQNEKIKIPKLYFARKRKVIIRNESILMIDDDRMPIEKHEKVIYKQVRFRTLGCYPLTAAMESDAKNVDQIINEMENTKFSERNGRLIDFDNPGSMEIKKREGYF